MNLSLSLGFIVSVVCLPFQSIAQPEVETKQEYSSKPGHLEPLGAKSIKHPVEVIQSYPDPKTFFKTYVVASKPVLIQNAAKLSPAFTKWTDEYFLSLPESTDYKIEAEQRKKERRTIPPEEMSFSEFVKTYKEQDIYMVNSVPQFIRWANLFAFPCKQVRRDFLRLYQRLWKWICSRRRFRVQNSLILCIGAILPHYLGRESLRLDIQRWIINQDKRGSKIGSRNHATNPEFRPHEDQGTGVRRKLMNKIFKSPFFFLKSVFTRFSLSSPYKN